MTPSPSQPSSERVHQLPGDALFFAQTQCLACGSWRLTFSLPPSRTGRSPSCRASWGRRTGMGQLRELRRSTAGAQSLVGRCQPIRCHPKPWSGVLVRRALYPLQDRGACLHLAFQVLREGLHLQLPCSSICQHKELFTQRSQTHLIIACLHAFVHVVLSTWNTLFLLCIQIKCHLPCEACLDPFSGGQCLLLRLLLPCLHTHSPGCLYGFSTLYQGSPIHRPTASCHPFLEHSPAVRVLALPSLPQRDRSHVYLVLAKSQGLAHRGCWKNNSITH